jgi:Acyl-CoA reductase (LuxC)
MDFLAPKSNSKDWQRQIGDLAEARPLLPFAHPVVNFIDGVSKRILADASARQWPELLVVAHWMRKSHLRDLEAAFRALREVRLPRGLVMHYAPTNVDSIFLYSWFISLLAGNSNIVRVSRRRGEQLDYLISRLNEVLELEEFKSVRDRNVLVSFEHDDAINTELCSQCDVRVIWGGDHTVAALRRIVLPPLATELAFADRFSLAVLRAGAICDASKEELQHLVKEFCNDAFSFDQLACSSPRLVVWVGPGKQIAAAQQSFWSEVSRCVAGRRISYPAIVTMNRVATAYAYAAAAQAQSIASISVTELPLRIDLQEDALDYREMHCGGGLFLEKQFAVLGDLASSLTAKDQTLSYFGYIPAELNELAMQLPARAVDRMVPIGQALDFSSTWDGVDMFQSFTRCVEIR